MQRFTFAVMSVAVIAILALVFFRVLRREPADAKADSVTGRAAAGSADSAEVARLRSEVEALRADVEKQKQRAKAAEEKLAAAGAATTDDAVTDYKKAAEKKSGGHWKKRRDAELEAKVKSMEWRKNVKGLIDYWKELEKSRSEGRAPRMDPDMVKTLTQLTADAGELHKFLGIEGTNVYDSFKNDVVSEAWVDSFLQEVAGGTLTEDQLARLRTTSLYDNQEPDLMQGNLFESWKYLIEHNHAYGTETAGILTQEQMAQVSKTVTPTFMLSVYGAYSERTLSSAAAVTDYWLDSYKVPAEQRAAVESVAADFTKQLSQLTQTYTNQYGTTLPRDADFEYRLKALELQMAAEKKLGESLNLDAEQLKKFLKGSGSVIKLSN